MLPKRGSAAVVVAGSLVCMALAAALLLASCATMFGHSAPWPGTFVRSEYVPYDSAGSGEIAGTGFAAPVTGTRMSIAWRTVTLTPATTWSALWWSRWVLRGNGLEDVDLRAAAYVREVIADSLGHFRFDRLPAGQYYLRSSILWWAGTSGRAGAAMTLVVLGKRVTLSPGQHAEVALDSLRTDANWFDPSWWNVTGGRLDQSTFADTTTNPLR